MVFRVELKAICKVEAESHEEAIEKAKATEPKDWQSYRYFSNSTSGDQ